MHALAKSKIDTKLLVILALVLLLDNYGETSLFIAFPEITFGLNAPNLYCAQWVIVGFMLTAGASQIFFGRLADQLGVKKIFISGISLFTLSSLVAVFSTSISMLITSRILQGVGYAMTFPLVITLVRLSFPNKQLGMAMGIIGSFSAISLITGPIISSVLLSFFGWRSVFLFNVPLGLVAITISFFFLKDHKEKNPKPPIHIELNIYLITLLSILFVLLSPNIVVGYPLLLLIISFTLLRLCILFKKNTVWFNSKLLKNKNFIIGSIFRFFLQCFIYSVFYIFSFMYQNAFSFSPVKTGIMFLVGLLVLALASPFVGKAIDKCLPCRLLTFGITLLLFMNISLSFLNADSSLIFLIIIMVIFGLGSAIFIPAVNVVSLVNVGRVEASFASAVYYTGVTLSGALSILITTIVLHIKGDALSLVSLNNSLRDIASNQARDDFFFSLHLFSGLWALVLIILMVFSLFLFDVDSNRGTISEQ